MLPKDAPWEVGENDISQTDLQRMHLPETILESILIQVSPILHLLGLSTCLVATLAIEWERR